MENDHDLKKRLLEISLQGRLGHFYILSSPPGIKQSKKHLSLWITEWIEDWCQAHNIAERHLLATQHPDTLHLQVEKDCKEYTLKDWDEFFNFLHFRPFALPHRFIVVEDTHLINEMIFNKLLKSLEEPPPNTTIFFLHAIHRRLLPTIEGRAQSLQIASSSSFPSSERPFVDNDTRFSLLKTLLQELPEGKILGDDIAPLLESYMGEKKNLLPLVEKIRENKEKENALYIILLELERHCLNSYQQKKKFLEQFQWITPAKAFQLNSGERLYSLLEEMSIT